MHAEEDVYLEPFNQKGKRKEQNVFFLLPLLFYLITSWRRKSEIIVTQIMLTKPNCATPFSHT